MLYHLLSNDDFWSFQMIDNLTKPIHIGKKYNPQKTDYIEYIKNNAWITIFGSRVRRFANDFHEWRSHEWKSLVNRLTRDPKMVIHGNECIILFLTRYFISWKHNSAKNNHRWLISLLSLRTVFSDLVLWYHHSWSVTSHKRRVLALWRHIRRLFLHAQIAANTIFTSE